mmetsp:Transcript_23460/g.73595  ORF Transcript_23460/g.73595 Transcript_23460/m.73595 type:complete len:136 (+) Transcript_23460:30-437(+)
MSAACLPPLQLSSSMGVLLLLASAALELKKRQFPTRGGSYKQWDTYVIVLMGATAAWMCLILPWFGVVHCALACCDCTTKEVIENKKARRGDPGYRRPPLCVPKECIRAWRGVWCAGYKHKHDVPRPEADDGGAS